MPEIEQILKRLLFLVGSSRQYFVTGSLSFLPLLDNYRQPEHDVDAAVAKEVFDRVLDPEVGESVKVLTLSEVAIAGEFALARMFSPKTSFVHIDGPGGLLDLSYYRHARNRFVFSLGLGLTLEIPDFITDGFRMLSWNGITYQAGPVELAFIPKAWSYLRARTAGDKQSEIDRKHETDLKRMMKVVDWGFVGELLRNSGIRYFHRTLPSIFRWAVDPFDADAILKLQHDPALLQA